MVESVEKFGAELQRLRLLDGDQFSQRHIPVVPAGPEDEAESRERKLFLFLENASQGGSSYVSGSLGYREGRKIQGSPDGHRGRPYIIHG